MQHVLSQRTVTHDAQRDAKQTTALYLINAMQGLPLATGTSRQRRFVIEKDGVCARRIR